MKKIFVGMSGGVDSSVSAALLKDQGYDVVGVFMKNWTQDLPGFECPWREDLADAKSVAAYLDIPLKIYDFQDKYKRKVVDYMIAEYKAGRTPNPDVMCNQEIKFRLFLDTAIEDGADGIATGHYAISKDGQLHAGKDENKDQSYFLYRVTSHAMEKTLMPVGELDKSKVRKIAADKNLPVSDKPDSQGLCFVGDISMRDFLSNFIDIHPGDVRDKNGKVLGQHDGAAFYTIGQRHGLGIGGGTPFYVIGKDMGKNEVYVTDDPEDLALHGDEFFIEDIHWINEPPVTGDKIYHVRTRYRADLIKCKLEEVSKSKYKVSMDQMERAISPGQSAVIYKGSRVVGGGIIASK